MSDVWNEKDEAATFSRETREDIAEKIEAIFGKVQEPTRDQIEETIKT